MEKRERRISYLILILYIVLAMTLIAGLLIFFEKRDNELMEWAHKYEKCVEENYLTTPSAWHQEHGNYPECDTSKY